MIPVPLCRQVENALLSAIFHRRSGHRKLLQFLSTAGPNSYGSERIHIHRLQEKKPCPL